MSQGLALQVLLDFDTISYRDLPAFDRFRINPAIGVIQIAHERLRHTGERRHPFALHGAPLRLAKIDRFTADLSLVHAASPARA